MAKICKFIIDTLLKFYNLSISSIPFFTNFSYCLFLRILGIFKSLEIILHFLCCISNKVTLSKTGISYSKTILKIESVSIVAKEAMISSNILIRLNAYIILLYILSDVLCYNLRSNVNQECIIRFEVIFSIVISHTEIAISDLRCTHEKPLSIHILSLNDKIDRSYCFWI